MSILHIVLDAPIMSFGVSSTSSVFSSDVLPHKSQIVGLIANAMNIQHREFEKLQALDENISIAARRERPGHIVCDYQTAFVPFDGTKTPIGWTSFGRLSERVGQQDTTGETKAIISANYEEGRFERKEFKASNIIMTKEFLCDSVVSCFVSIDDHDVFARAVEALKRPARILFLGRKDFLPGRPIFESVLCDSRTVAEAVHSTPALPIDGLNSDDSQNIRVLARWPLSADGDEEEINIKVLNSRKNWRTGFHVGSEPYVEKFIDIKKGE